MTTPPDGGLSTSLVQPQSNMPGSFPQQGQLSWVDLSQTMVSFPVDMNARVAAADIHVNTLFVS